MFGIFSKKKNIEEVENTVSVESTQENVNSKNNCEEIDIFNNPNHQKSWEDKNTQLIWEVKSKDNYEKLYTYQESLEYAKSLNRKHYGMSGRWRVPTIDELLTLGVKPLFDYREKSSKFKGRADWKKRGGALRNGKLFVKKPFAGFMNMQIESWYWSSTEVTSFLASVKAEEIERLTDAAWSVNFFEGGNYHNSKEQRNSVICVRDMIKK